MGGGARSLPTRWASATPCTTPLSVGRRPHRWSAIRSPSRDEPITYTWDLGDGATDSGAHVTHAYSAAGDYAIVLTVTNCGGSTDVVADVITVVPPCDRVEIVTVTTSITGCVVTFEAGVEGAAPFDYLWDFGALGTSTETRPTVDSVISGTYAYTLTVVNCGGAGQDTWSDSVVVECAPSYRIYLPLVTRQS